jgi:L-ascorbate metabolism protein UlaG (beta-lactamase superfamily)
MRLKKAKRVMMIYACMTIFMTACGKEKTETEAAATSAAAGTLTPTAAATPMTTEAPTPTATNTPSPIATFTPTATSAPTNTPTPVPEEKEEIMAAKLLYQGHASIRITTAEGKTIYVDPFMGEGYDVPADLILITHGHSDHTQTQLIKTKNPDCETITYKEALKGGEHQSFDLGYVKVEAVEAGYNRNHNVKDCVGYILTFSNGATLYLSGDTSKTKDMDHMAERELDYAFLCCDGVYNMDTKEASECAELIGAKHSIPYHMIPANKGNGFDRKVAESFNANGRIILEPGEELDIE